MTATRMTTYADEATAYDRRTPLASRMLLLLVAIVLGAAGTLANVLSGYNGDEISVKWLADHPHAWVFATYGTVLSTMGLVAFLLAVCVLVRTRGATWATVGLATGAVGASLIAVGSVMPMALTGINGQNVVPPADLDKLIDYVAQHDVTAASLAFPGFLLLLVTQIVVTVALVRARTVPIWVPIAFIVGGVVETVFAASGVLTAVLTVPQLVAMVAVGWYAYRRSS